MVETCSKTAADCPCPGFSVHRANGAGLSARCGRPFFLSPKIQMRSRQLPAGRGLLQIYLCFCNAGKGNLATGGAENFSFHSLHHRVLKFAKHQGKNFPLTHYYNRQGAKWPGSQTGNKKSSKSFSDLLLLLVAGGGWYLVLKVRVRLAQQIRICSFVNFPIL